MPAKYRVKDYQVKSYYHIYNRGIEGKVVFEQEGDYHHFEKLMEQYLIGPTKDPRVGISPSRFKYKQQMCLKGELEMLAYCLMPDHFHLLVHQESKDTIIRFMRRVMTGYVMYFNRRKGRSGPLFESNYRAAKAESLQEVVALAKYIHLNPANRVVRRFGPVETVTGVSPADYIHSSLGFYIGTKQGNWINKLPELVKSNEELINFDRARKEGFEAIKHLTIDSSG